MENLDINTFKEKVETDEKAVVLDVRTAEEEVEGKIPNSLNINIMSPDFPAKVLELDKSKNYYVYCRSGGRSGSACEFMAKNGFNSYNLIGGIQAWNSLK